MRKMILLGAVLLSSCHAAGSNDAPVENVAAAAVESGEPDVIDDPVVEEIAKGKQAEYKAEYLNNHKPWKRATCDFGDGDGKEPCDFRFSEDGDGSFEARELGEGGVIYYFTLTAKDEMVVERYQAALVPMGGYIRDPQDRACWKEEGDDGRICVW